MARVPAPQTHDAFGWINGLAGDENTFRGVAHVGLGLTKKRSAVLATNNTRPSTTAVLAPLRSVVPPPAPLRTPVRQPPFAREDQDRTITPRHYGTGLGRRSRSLAALRPAESGSSEQYSSLQNMLEDLGFSEGDRRIVTPIHVARPQILKTVPLVVARSYSTSPNRATVYPPYSRSTTKTYLPLPVSHSPDRSLRPSASMVLLRGVLSIWSSSPAGTVVDEPAERQSTESDAGSIYSVQHETMERAKSWANDVAQQSQRRPSPPPAPIVLVPTLVSTYTSYSPLPICNDAPSTPGKQLASTGVSSKHAHCSPPSLESHTNAQVSLRSSLSRPATSSDNLASMSYHSFGALSPASSIAGEPRLEYDDHDGEEEEPTRHRRVKREPTGNWRSLLQFSKSLSNLGSHFVASGPIPPVPSLPPHFTSTTTYPPPPSPPASALRPSQSHARLAPRKRRAPAMPVGAGALPIPKPVRYGGGGDENARRGPTLLRKAVSSYALRPVLTSGVVMRS